MLLMRYKLHNPDETMASTFAFNSKKKKSFYKPKFPALFFNLNRIPSCTGFVR